METGGTNTKLKKQTSTTPEGNDSSYSEVSEPRIDTGNINIPKSTLDTPEQKSIETLDSIDDKMKTRISNERANETKSVPQAIDTI